ncbi:hypothetical protein J5N97_023191 [Dioscorea zingiberensis]|uniref:MaoC-like domain-containing protein n=1 Tax=Dioscorea zingiberensis TaxID=325984 RepID=A0A9D5CCB0_9LILI|nr:hypothetical protein J5N97_023191 [Dioscorea zingiberensis]
MILGRLIRAAAFGSTAGVPPGILGTGDVLKEARRFSDADVARFAEVSGYRNPVHFDADFARSAAGFAGGRVVHGMLVASLFPSIIASHFPGAIYVSQTLQFKLPVYIGDEIVAEVQALSLREHKKRFIVRFTDEMLYKHGATCHRW